MKKTYLSIGVILVVVLCVFGFMQLPDAPSRQSSTNNEQQVPSTQEKTVQFAGISQEVQSGIATLLDVRTPEEYNTSHFANATLFPLQTIESGTLPNFAKDSKIYLYCRSGNRSAQATTLLQKAGFTNITDLGGLSDVEQVGGVLLQ